MDKELLEVVQKKSARDSNVQKVIEVEATPALAKGENYSSKILRLKAKVVLGNGRTATKSIIMKQVLNLVQLGGEHNRNLVKVESDIYSKVHREMVYLMEEFEDSSDKPWCNFIHCDVASSIILLEDLKPLGYKVVPRQKGLDLEHAQFALEALGRFHGMAKVLEERGIVSKDDYDPCYTLTHDVVLKSMMYTGIQRIAKAMKESWDSRWEEVAEKLLSLDCDKFVAKMLSMSKPEAGEFTVLNHGDCWSNNMMFKYDWSDRPISVKFVDYQIPHYNTPCVDITNLLYLGVQPSIRRQNYPLLIETYHESLVRTLNKFQYSGNKPTIDNIIATMDRLSFFGMAVFVSVYANLIYPEGDSMDMEKLIESGGEEGYNPQVLRQPGIVDKMGPDLLEFVEVHLQRLA